MNKLLNHAANNIIASLLATMFLIILVGCSSPQTPIPVQFNTPAVSNEPREESGPTSFYSIQRQDGTVERGSY